MYTLDIYAVIYNTINIIYIILIVTDTIYIYIIIYIYKLDILRLLAV